MNQCEKAFIGKESPFFWISLFGIAFVVRLLPLYVSHFTPDADEAIVGLMALHLTKGAPYPTFYYGQHYMGSLEPIMVSWVFSLVGVGNWQLKVVPFFWSLLLIPTGYLLASRVFTPKYAQQAARFTAWYLAFPPSALLEWGCKARGGFIEIVVATTFLLASGLYWLRAQPPRYWHTSLLGFIAGVGWWTNNLIVFCLIPLGGAAFIRLFVLLRKKKLRISALFNHYFLGILLFIIGCAPYLWYNLTYPSGGWPSSGMFHPAPNIGDQVQALFSDSFPILLGAKPFWSDVDLYPGATIIVSSLMLLSIVCALIGFFPRGASKEKVLSFDGGLILFFTTILACTLFVSSTFGVLTSAPRYLLPLYSIVPLMGAALYGYFLRYPPAHLVVITTFTGVHLASLFYPSLAVPKEPFVFEKERVSHSFHELIAWLTDRGISLVRTNYWIGYRLAFETEENVKFLMLGDPYQIRIPEYETHYASYTQSEIPWVVTSSQSLLVERGLSKRGFHFNKEYVGDYVVFSNVMRPTNSYVPREIPEGSVITATHGNDSVSLSIDGNHTTRWGSAHPQVPGMTVILRFPKPIVVSGVDLAIGQWSSDFPQSLSILCSDSDDEQNAVEVVSPAQSQGGEYVKGAVGSYGGFQWPDRLCKVLFFRQEGSHPVVDWSIAEINLFTRQGEK
jgi:hypothetical protein